MVILMSVRPKKASKNRGQQRIAMTRKKLKDAALDVFSEKSVDAATVQDITEKADLGKGTLYRHFADKEEVVLVLVEDAIEHLIKRIRSYPEELENLEDVLEHFFNAHYDFFAENSEEFVLLFRGRLLLKLQDDVAEDLEEPYLRYLKEIENQVSHHVSPEIDPAKIHRLACAVAGFISGYFSFAMIGMDEDEIETSIKPLKRAFVRSLCVFLGRE
jgi:AcrR family transcriptional regulator